MSILDEIYGQAMIKAARKDRAETATTTGLSVGLSAAAAATAFPVKALRGEQAAWRGLEKLKVPKAVIDRGTKGWWKNWLRMMSDPKGIKTRLRIGGRAGMIAGGAGALLGLAVGKKEKKAS